MPIELTSTNVDEVFSACLFTDEEAKTVTPDDAVVAEAVMMNVGFHPGRLEENKEKIKQLLDQLPEHFQQDKGGGSSFLQACMTARGVHWAEHPTIDKLVALGLAAKHVEYKLPRELWGALPGGMPYFAVV